MEKGELKKGKDNLMKALTLNNNNINVM